MASRASRTVTFFLACALTLAGAGAATQRQSGDFALYRGKPQIESHVTLVNDNVLDIVQYPLHSDSPLVRYVMTEHEPLHVILVRDDFRSFQHVHPKAAGRGHYRVAVALDSGHRYYAYVASRPVGTEPQVFRFTLQAGAPPHHVATSLLAPTTQSLAGPFHVKLNTASFPARKDADVQVSVSRRNGAPVSVSPYAGAAAHTVFVSPATLDYVHVDAKRDGSERLNLRIPPLAQGTYRMWLQFRDNGATFTAPFTLAVR